MCMSSSWNKVQLSLACPTDAGGVQSGALHRSVSVSLEGILKALLMFHRACIAMYNVHVCSQPPECAGLLHTLYI